MATTVDGAPRGRARDLNLDPRQGVGRLTLQRYGAAYHDHSVWLTDVGMPPFGVLAGGDLGLVNEVSTAYFQHMYTEGLPYSRGPYVLAAAQYFHRRLWGNLRGAWSWVRTWKLAEPGEMRRPIPVLVFWGLLAIAPAQEGVQLAALLAMTFHCFLRPGEACRMTKRDIILPGDLGWHAQVGMVVIRSPKTARVSGRVQHVVLRDPLVILLCQWAWLSWPLGRPLISMTLRELERWFRDALVLFDLRATQFTPAGLRAGGTTHACLSGSNVEQLMWRGRWESLTSLRHYIRKRRLLWRTHSFRRRWW